jgi:hypothetical protein
MDLLQRSKRLHKGERFSSYVLFRQVDGSVSIFYRETGQNKNDLKLVKEDHQGSSSVFYTLI